MTSIESTGHLLLATFVVVACTLVESAADEASAAEPPVLQVAASRVAMPVALTVSAQTLDEVSNGADVASFELIELNVAGEVHDAAPIQVQLTSGATTDGTVDEASQQLLVVIPGGYATDRLRRFCLQPVTNKPPARFRFEDANDASLKLWQGDDPVFVYNHGEITGERVPQDDSRRRRACYIHPVWSPGGVVVTDDFPADHYHHHGIFWCWPHVHIGDEVYDLWTYGNIQQRFVHWICREVGPAAAVLAVENGWFVGERKVMVERVWMRTFAADDGRRSLDVRLTLIPTDRDVTLQGAAGKSYGGLNMRFAPRDDQQTVITVPSGPAAEDLPLARLQWADFTSLFVGATNPSGATVMIDPSHPDFPPTWLTRHYGALFVGYPGVVAKTFPAGEPFTLNYRVNVHDGAANVDELKRDYAGYTSSLEARWSE